MRIIVDAMSGDHAPLEIVKGAALAVQELGVELLLVGDERRIRKVLAENNLTDNNIEIVHTDDIITMDDDPISIVKTKKESSMGKAFTLLSQGAGDALVSAGNSGAILTASTLVVKRIEGIKRAALGVVLPFEHIGLLIDAGANVDIKAEYLKQFGIMGSIYMNSIFKIKNPTVGLANNGTERTKGTNEHIEAYKLLEDAKNINFVGNIEGRDITTNCSDVLVTDGFTGNMILKLTEGFGVYLNKKLKSIFLRDMFTKVAAVLVKNSLSEFKASLDQSEYGGAPLLGIKRPVIKAHGSANAKSLKNAIRQAKFCVETKITEEIEKQCDIK